MAVSFKDIVIAQECWVCGHDVDFSHPTNMNALSIASSIEIHTALLACAEDSVTQHLTPQLRHRIQRRINRLSEERRDRIVAGTWDWKLAGEEEWMENISIDGAALVDLIIQNRDTPTTD